MANTMLTSGGDAWLRSVTYPSADLPGTQTRSMSCVDQEFDESGRLADITSGSSPCAYPPQTRPHYSPRF